MRTCEEMYRDIQTLVKGGQHEEAVDTLENLLEIYPDFAQGHNDLGILYHKLGNREKTLNHLREAVNHDQENIPFLKNLADFYYSEMGNAKEALDYYHKILAVYPHDIDALTISGHIAVSEHRFDDAKGLYKKVLDIEPWNDDVWNYLERLDEYVSRSSEAVQTEEVYLRCQDLANSGQNEAAIRELKKLIQMDSEFAPAYNDLGVLNYGLGNKEEAVEYYEKAVLLEPNNFVFQKNLADFYYVEMGRIEDALEIYAKVLSEEPTDVDCLMAAGQISEKLNLKDNAIIFYDRILDIEPWNLVAGEKINELCANSQDNKEFTALNRNIQV